MRNYISLFAIFIAGEVSQQCLSFVHNPSLVRNTAFFAIKPHPEYSIDDESDTTESVSIGSAPSGDYFSITLPKEEPEAPPKSAPTQKPEYGALQQGTVIKIQVGDIALARKAWKKRRRTGSPLLVPCSVLNVDRQSMVRWNMIYLLEKFGSSEKDGIQISASDMANKYRTFLKSSLQNQADALSYSSNNDMIRELFNKKTQEAYGVRLVEKDDQLFLKAPISKRKAHQRTAKTPMLQFRLPKKSDHGDEDTMTHTGFMRTRKEDSEDREYGFLPLSAALRVSQKDDVDSGRVEEGSIHSAVVFDYDAMGDGGSPLLTLSLNPRGTRDFLKVKPDRKFLPIKDPKCMFNELSAGQGPFSAKVVQLLPGRALVDMQVGRAVSEGEGMLNVLGTLQFRDSFEPDPSVAKQSKWLIENDDDDDNFDDNYEDDSESVIAASLEDLDAFDFGDEDEDFDDEAEDEEGDLAEQLLALRDPSTFEEGTFEEGEEEEDVSDLFEVNDDGSVVFTDPDTGKPILLNDDDEEEEEAPKGFGSKKVKEEPAVKKQKMTHQAAKQSEIRLVSKHLKVGDVVDVFVRNVSKQSGQFAVTMNPAVQGRKAKDMKKENDASKKLKRLKKSLGGDLRQIYELEGSECDGTVKAASKTGDWLYVDPDIDGLPVGVAAMSEELTDINSGDRVRVRIDGVDEERGQLALQVLGKQ
eukprot:CAMPEP_0113610942 /NCGR_PEP_ID=MMETSP0017_2-20120614/5293_1 /TAXON_ID=2856 /ORGANISM="Cylindrotheca closterium" /LENGTH=695 /DNA_ID=CAMNT_0000519859 /DNA_START=36 /DNA_END=2123 /DNA_ORIENTATION=- /assembly_acc=CAM_ASM_000147